MPLGRVPKFILFGFIAAFSLFLARWGLFPLSPAKPKDSTKISVPDPPQIVSAEKNSCQLTYASLCPPGKTRRDPTGRGMRDSNVELAALRQYRKILRAHRDLSIEEVDEIFAKKAYPPESRERLEKVFGWVKRQFIRKIQKELQGTLSAALIRRFVDRIQKVVLELPPPRPHL